MVSKKSSLRAFTLIEMILAVALFAVVASSMYLAMRSGLLLHARSEEGLREAHMVQYFFREFDQELKHSFVYGEEPFSGKEKELAFTTLKKTYSKEGARRDIVRVEYELKPTSIVKKMTFLTEKEKEPLKTEILVSYTERPSFSYGYYDEVSDAIEWESEWDFEKQKNIPKGVRCTMALRMYDSAKKMVREKKLERKFLIPFGVWGKSDA